MRRRTFDAPRARALIGVDKEQSNAGQTAKFQGSRSAQTAAEQERLATAEAFKDGRLRTLRGLVAADLLPRPTCPSRPGHVSRTKAP